MNQFFFRFRYILCNCVLYDIIKNKMIQLLIRTDTNISNWYWFIKVKVTISSSVDKFSLPKCSNLKHYANIEIRTRVKNLHSNAMSNKSQLRMLRSSALRVKIIAKIKFLTKWKFCVVSSIWYVNWINSWGQSPKTCIILGMTYF